MDLNKQETILGKQSIERQLLVGTASMELDASSLAEVGGLLEHEIDWDLLITQSLKHGTTGLLYKNLFKVGEELIPEAVQEKLKKYYLMFVISGMRQLTQFKPVAQALSDAGVPIMVLKGAALTRSIYGGDIGLRPISDVDIMVREQDWPRIYNILAGSEFRPAAGKDFSAILPKLTRYDVEAHVQFLSEVGVCLEFQFDLLTLGIGMRDVAGVWDRSRESEIEGVRVQVAGPEDQLLHLIIHANRHGCARIKWMVDITEILQCRNCIDWDLFVEIARRENVVPCVYSTLAHIERLFARQYVKPEILSRLRPRGYQRLLWRAVWPDSMLDEFRGRHEDAVCFYYYRPLSGWNLINFALTNRVRDKMAYQLRWMFPSMGWMSQTYGKPKSLALLKYYPIRLLDRRSRRKAEPAPGGGR
ncbi:MAG: nucleotidyltransferase domain-containing protein [Thermoleophilia bacterium]